MRKLLSGLEWQSPKNGSHYLRLTAFQHCPTQTTTTGSFSRLHPSPTKAICEEVPQQYAMTQSHSRPIHNTPSGMQPKALASVLPLAPILSFVRRHIQLSLTHLYPGLPPSLRQWHTVLPKLLSCWGGLQHSGSTHIEFRGPSVQTHAALSAGDVLRTPGRRAITQLDTGLLVVPLVS